MEIPDLSLIIGNIKKNSGIANKNLPARININPKITEKKIIIYRIPFDIFFGSDFPR